MFKVWLEEEVEWLLLVFWLEGLSCLTNDEDEVGRFMSEVGKMDSDSECLVLDDDGDNGIFIIFSLDGDTGKVPL